MANGQIKARIRCVVDVPVGVWGGSGSVDLDALAEQVRREGKEIVTRFSREAGGAVVGEPKVLFLLLEEDESS